MNASRRPNDESASKPTPPRWSGSWPSWVQRRSRWMAPCPSYANATAANGKRFGPAARAWRPCVVNDQPRSTSWRLSAAGSRKLSSSWGAHPKRPRRRRRARRRLQRRDPLGSARRGAEEDGRLRGRPRARPARRLAEGGRDTRLATHSRRLRGRGRDVLRGVEGRAGLIAIRSLAREMEMDTFSSEDRARIEAQGLTVEEVERQAPLLRDPPPAVTLVRPCTISDGVERIAESEHEELLSLADVAALAERLSKCVPG